MKSGGYTGIRDSARHFKRIARDVIKLSKRTVVAQWLKKYQFNKKLRKVRSHQKRELKRIKKKKSVNVVFFVIHGAVWKYDTIYKLMERDDRFNPVILICPYTVYGKEAMTEELNHSFESFYEKGYNVVKSYNEKDDSFIDVNREMSPDIICFTNPWNITRREYLIEHYLDKLTCYVPYGYKCSHLHSAHYNKPMQNFAWKFFIETHIHKKNGVISRP